VSKAQRVIKDSKVAKVSRAVRDFKVGRGIKGSKDFKVGRVGREYRGPHRINPAHRDGKDGRDSKAVKVPRGTLPGGDWVALLVPKVPKVLRG